MAFEKKIYCISGLGADEMVFKNLFIDGFSLHYIPWLQHQNGETLEDYSLRMAEQIQDEDPTILGLSLGGMIGVEIARKRSVKKLIIISGIKTRKELPLWMRIAGNLRMNKWLPAGSNKLTRRYDDRMLGISNAQEKKLAESYRRKLDKKFQLWAINQVLNWRNSWYPEGTIHIHGENDRLFPVKYVTPTHLIKKGTHMMIINKSEEISECLGRIVGNSLFTSRRSLG